jgi:hypothetical protein
MLIDSTPSSKDPVRQTVLKEKPDILLFSRNLIDINKHYLKVKGLKKIYQANALPKQRASFKQSIL